MLSEFILTKAQKKYGQKTSFPKISVSETTYKQLQSVALKSGQSVSSVANQAITHALSELRWVDE